MKLATISEDVDRLRKSLELEYGDFLDNFWLSEGSKYIMIENIRIKLDHRGSGIGEKIILAIQKYASDVGKSVILYAEHDSRKKTALARFYKKLGFKRISSRNKDYSLPLHTHIWYP